MSPEQIIWSLTAASITSCMVSGVFLAFSDFVMRSLRLATPEASAQAMQIINREVLRSIFIVLLVGMAPFSAVIGGLTLYSPPAVGSTLILFGSVSYVVGVFVVSLVGNVPKNSKLAAMPDGGVEAQKYWPKFYTGWMLWNHVRGFFALVTALCYIGAAIKLAMAM